MLVRAHRFYPAQATVRVTAMGRFNHRRRKAFSMEKSGKKRTTAVEQNVSFSSEIRMGPHLKILPRLFSYLSISLSSVVFERRCVACG